jgi:hypothetical protein
VKTFKRVIDLIRQGRVEDKVRANMLQRMAQGHINFIETGGWNLEKEIWHRES